MRRLVILAAAALLLVSCQDKNEKTDIGFLGTLSGRYADIGQDTLKGVMLSLEQNDTAHTVNLVIKDDAGHPKEALKHLKDLENAGVRYIIGPNLSDVAGATVPYLEGRYMFMLSPTVSSSSLAGLDDHFMRSMPHNSQKQAENIAIYLISKLKIKDVVIIFNSKNSTYAKDIVTKFSDSFMARGGQIRDVRGFAPEDGKSMKSLIEKDKGNPPQMYYIVASAMDSSLIIWQIKKAGYNSGILIRGWAATNEFFRFTGEAAEGVMLFDYYIDNTSKNYENFNNAYKTKYQKEPTWFSIHGYECAKMLVDAMPKLKDGDSFLDALSAVSSGLRLMSDFSFDENGDSYMPLNFFTVKDGKLKRIGPAE